MNQITENQYKRNIAYKRRIGDILEGKPIIENERLKWVESKNQNLVRINLVANVIEKFIQDEEKKFGSITLDDATGQIKAKVFGDEISKLKDILQGDTLLIIGLLRYWNSEIYITPEIIKKKDPKYLLVRKLEVEAEEPKKINKEQLVLMKDKIIQKLKEAESSGGLDIESLILELKESPEIVNREIKKLLEDGVAYEPRPGKLRYLG